MGVPLYTLLPRLPFLVAAASVVASNVAFTAFFCARLKTVSSGRFGGLAAARCQLEGGLERIARGTGAEADF